jgi:hypothetical protein
MMSIGAEQRSESAAIDSSNLFARANYNIAA